MAGRYQSGLLVQILPALSGLFAICAIGCAPLILHAQNQPPREHSEKRQQAQKSAPGVPVGVHVNKVTLQYRSEVSFYMPDGEFAAYFRKKFGYFSTITQARYNFLRGEIEFKSENLFTKYRIAPQLAVFDRLTFVPLFDRDKIWRREQAMQAGLLIPIRQSFKTLTSFNFTRYTFPSINDPKNLESYRALGFSQAFGAEIDSAHIFGVPFRGAIDLQIDKAFPYANSNTNFWLLHIRGWQTSELPYLTITGEIDRIALLRGFNPPLRFLGGLDRLSAYQANELSGYDLSYFSIKTLAHLLGRNQPFYRNWGISRTDFVLHFEAARLNGGEDASGAQTFHTSLGFGMQMACTYGGSSLLKVFFLAYKRFDLSRQPRFYLGVKL